MATKIYLGYPPAKIREWIENNANNITDMNEPLTFTAEQCGGEIEIILSITDMADNIGIEYSYDGTSWENYINKNKSRTLDEETFPVIKLTAPGEKVMFRAIDKNDNIGTGYDSEGTIVNTQFNIFTSENDTTSKIKLSGNIMSLLDKTYKQTTVPANCFMGLFRGISIITSAPYMPTINVGDKAYSGIFSDRGIMSDKISMKFLTYAKFKSLQEEHNLFGDEFVPGTIIEVECSDKTAVLTRNFNEDTGPDPEWSIAEKS